VSDVSFISRNSSLIHFNSHQEPMMRSTPNEFSLFGKGSWDYTINAANINQYWLEGTERARSFESVYTLGMRGFGDCKLVLFFAFSFSDHGF
jgi:Glycosyl hydrolase family 115